MNLITGKPDSPRHHQLELPQTDPAGFSLSLRHVCKRFLRGGESIRAVEDVSLQIASGERIAILGRSGSGKSTLLNLIGGLEEPTSGELTIEKTDLAKLNTNQRARFRRQGIGMVFQSFQLIGHRSALGNVELPLLFDGMGARRRRQVALTLLASLGLSDRAKHRPSQLSGGQQQRVAIARALACRPRLLLADEPTGNLDSQTAAEIIRLLIELSQRTSMTMILVTHDRDLADNFADRTLTMVDGRWDNEGDPQASQNGGD